MMALDIGSFQPELVDSVCSWLDTKDRGALRLTNRNLCSKVSGGSFRQTLKRKTLRLLPRNVENFFLSTENSGLGCAIQKLRIIGIALDPSLPEEELELHDSRNLGMLIKAFLNIKLSSPGASLESLTLLVDGCFINRSGVLLRPPHFHSSSLIWQTARRTFRVVMEALTESELAVNDTFKVFFGLVGCSLPLDLFLSIPPGMPSFATLKQLSVSLSLPRKDGPEVFLIPDDDSESHPIEFGHHGTQAKGNQFLPNIRQVIALSMPKLETLNLHWFNLGSDGTDEIDKKLLVQTSMAVLPTIPACSLGGLVASEASLRSFIQSLSANVLSVITCELTDGNWDAIFDYFEDEKSPIDYYLLKDLQLDQGALIHFGSPSQLRSEHPFMLTYRIPEPWPRVIGRQPKHATDNLMYRQPVGRPLDTEDKRLWANDRVEEYGPLNGGQWYDFNRYNGDRI